MIATGNHLRFRIRCALQHAPTLTRPYAYEEEASGKGRRGRRPLRWDRTVVVCFQSSRRDTFMRHGAIHGETNSCPKAIHARKGNSLAIGRHAAPGRVLSEILGNAWISAGQSSSQLR